MPYGFSYGLIRSFHLVINGCPSFPFSLSGFGESDEATYCEHFLKAFEEGDEELLAKTKCQPTVTHLDTEVSQTFSVPM